jgi:uncharacterized cupredoxin-like copper-binding protein
MFNVRNALLILIAAGLLLTACSTPGASKTQEVKITLTEFGIQSSLTNFEVGVPYHFVVTNAGSVDHELMVMPPLKEDSMGMTMDMGELDKTALVMIEASELAPGKSASFDLTFTEPTSAGNLELACHTPGHYEAGMKLPIIVE